MEQLGRVTTAAPWNALRLRDMIEASRSVHGLLEGLMDELVCPKCGGDLETNDLSPKGVCRYCGTEYVVEALAVNVLSEQVARLADIAMSDEDRRVIELDAAIEDRTNELASVQRQLQELQSGVGWTPTPRQRLQLEVWSKREQQLIDELHDLDAGVVAKSVTVPSYETAQAIIVFVGLFVIFPISAVVKSTQLLFAYVAIATCLLLVTWALARR